MFQHSITLILDSSQASCPIIMFRILINTVINCSTRDETLSMSEYNLVVAGCWVLTISSSVTRPKPKSLMSNDCQCKPPPHLRFILCSVQDIGLLMTVWATEVGTLLWKCDEVLTSPWHLGDISLQRSVINWSKLQTLISWLTSCHRRAAQLTQHVGKLTTVPASICPSAVFSDHRSRCAVCYLHLWSWCPRLPRYNNPPSSAQHLKYISCPAPPRATQPPARRCLALAVAIAVTSFKLL